MHIKISGIIIFRYFWRFPIDFDSYPVLSGNTKSVYFAVNCGRVCGQTVGGVDFCDLTVCTNVVKSRFSFPPQRADSPSILKIYIAPILRRRWQREHRLIACGENSNWLALWACELACVTKKIEGEWSIIRACVEMDDVKSPPMGGKWPKTKQFQRKHNNSRFKCIDKAGCVCYDTCK